MEHCDGAQQQCCYKRCRFHLDTSTVLAPARPSGHEPAGPLDVRAILVTKPLSQFLLFKGGAEDEERENEILSRPMNQLAVMSETDRSNSKTNVSTC